MYKRQVLGGAANICYEYATKRYRSNCINWGILPFTLAPDTPFDYETDDYIFVPGIRQAILSGQEEIPATVLSAGGKTPITLYIKGLTEDEKKIILEGCLIPGGSYVCQLLSLAAGYDLTLVLGIASAVICFLSIYIAMKKQSRRMLHDYLADTKVVAIENCK